MRIGMLAFSQAGLELGERLISYFKHQGDTYSLSRCEKGGLSDWSNQHFSQEDALIFLGSCGIAVRAIAPFVQSKVTDPAVVVIDEGGNFVIPLLSGHLGGANELAMNLADFLGAAAAITTATDVRGLFAVDLWAKKQGLFIANPAKIKDVSAKILAGDTLLLKSEYPVEGPLPERLILTGDPSLMEKPVSAEDSVLAERLFLPEKSAPAERPALEKKLIREKELIRAERAAPAEKCSDAHILVSHKIGGAGETGSALHLIPPVLTLGVGCKKNTLPEALEKAFSLILERARCHPAAVKQVCTIDLKAKEPGLLKFCQSLGLPLRTFTPAELNALPGSFTGSDFVKSVTGVDNVCERCALLGSSQSPCGPRSETGSSGRQQGRLIAGKTPFNGVTMALALTPYTLKMENETK